MSSSTRYLMPLLPPGLIRHSSCNSKLSYCPVVTISPPCLLCSPLPATCLIAPSSMAQPSSGICSLRKPFQPFQLLPSNRSFQPAAFSACVSVAVETLFFCFSEPTRFCAGLSSETILTSKMIISDMPAARTEALSGVLEQSASLGFISTPVWITRDEGKKISARLEQLINTNRSNQTYRNNYLRAVKPTDSSVIRCFCL